MQFIHFDSFQKTDLFLQINNIDASEENTLPKVRENEKKIMGINMHPLKW